MTLDVNIDIHKDCVSTKDHLFALIRANDQRYSEVNIEKEKALKIKEEADKIALGLAREIQTYKDETHNGLLKQWQSERGTYVTSEKFYAIINPILDYVNTQRGKDGGIHQGWIYLLGLFSLVATVLAIIGFFKT